MDKILQARNLSAEDMERLLAQARRHLWLNEVDQARGIFEHVATKAQEQIKKSTAPNTAYTSLIFHARLGLWSVSYLRDQSHRSEVMELLNGQSPDVETASFITKVFQLRGDTSDEALKIYRTHLMLDPSPGTARRVRDLVANLTFSHTALALYETLESILPDDLALSSKLCRWYLLVNDQQNAEQLAQRILGFASSHQEAQRCLAVIAEKREDWATAIRYYRLTRDYLRLAVVLARSGQYSGALKALDAVSDAEQITSTWLYYRGWIAYVQGEPSSSIVWWDKLQKQKVYPHASAAQRDALGSLTLPVFDDMQQGLELSDAMIEQLGSAGIDVSILEARKGAVDILRHGNIAQGKTLLQRAVQAQKSNIRLVSYLALAEVQERQDPAADRQIYEQLVTYYGDASLFMWLRGLTLLKSGHKHSAQYLQKAYADGVCKRHLPPEAMTAANWLLHAASVASVQSNDLDLAQLDQAPASACAFLWAVVSSYTLDKIRRHETASWITARPPGTIDTPYWNIIRAAYYYAQKDWSASFAELDDRSTDLRWRLLLLAVDDALHQQDWLMLAAYVRQGLTINHTHPGLKRLEKPLRSQIYQVLWHRGDLERLDYELEAVIRTGNAPTELYHSLALIYMRLAVTKDRASFALGSEQTEAVSPTQGQRTPAKYTGFLENQAHNDYWQLAIGYWAVALSDDAYWQAWCARRSTVYGETVSTEQIYNLVTDAVPGLLRAYHEEQCHLDSPVTTHHRFYTSLIAREIESTRAMRYLIRQTSGQQVADIPDSIRHFISPLLIKEYGYIEHARALIIRMEGRHISPYELGLVRSAFSPVADAQALVGIKAYDMALQILRTYLSNPKYVPMQSELTSELCHTLELAVAQHLDLEQWETALHLAREGQRLQPRHHEFQQLAIKAVTGMANAYVRKGMFNEAIRELKKVRVGQRQSDANLDTLLSEIYVEWGYEAANDDDFDNVIHRLGKALSVLPSNTRAITSLKDAYYHRAIGKAQASKYVAALEDAELALKYGEDAKTLVLLARLCRSIAVRFEEKKAFKPSHSHWDAAAKYAMRQLELADTQESLAFFVEISVSRVLSLYSQDNNSAAIDLAERLIKIAPDKSLYDIDIEKLLSEMYTNYGASLYNSGHKQQGYQLMRKALQYDPQNEVARQNMSIMQD